MLWHFKSLTPSKSIVPQKSNSKEKYPYVRVDTVKPMRINDILTKNSCLLPYASVLEYG